MSLSAVEAPEPGTLIDVDGEPPLPAADQDGITAQSSRVPGSQPATGPEARSGGFGVVSRASAWYVCATAAVLLIMSGQPMALGAVALALSCAVSVAAAGPGAQRSVVGLLPVGFLVVCTWAMAWGLAMSVVGSGGWSSRAAAAAGVLALILVVGLVSRQRAGRVHLWGQDLPALIGMLGLGGLGIAVVVTQPLEIWSRVMGSGTDFARHLFHIRALVEAGSMPFGQVGYPRGLHVPIALLVSALGVEPTMDALWRAVATLVWLMLCLVLVAVMAAAGRLAERLSSTRGVGPVAATIAGLAFIQTAWFDTLIGFGSVMNILVALALTTLLVVGLQPRVFGTALGSLTAAGALAVTANAWQLLLPLTGIAALPWILQWARRGWRRPADLGIWLLGGVVALNGLADQRTRNVGRLVTGATVSDLFRPEWWWWVAIAVAALALLAAFRRGLRTWAVSITGLALASVATVAVLLRSTGSSWDLMLYYPVKALWTSMVVIIPLAAAGLVWLTLAGWSRVGAGHLALRLVGRGLIALAIGVMVLGVGGRGAAFPPHLAKIATGQVGYPNWSMASVESLTQLPSLDNGSQGAIAFGVVPSAPIGAVRSRFVGMVDYMVMESLRFAGIDEATFTAPIKSALRDRDMAGICYYLTQHPRALRITGPNPQAGPTWLLDSGCPEQTVAPDEWVVLNLDPSWQAGSPWEAGFGPFPTFDQVVGEVDGVASDA